MYSFHNIGRISRDLKRLLRGASRPSGGVASAGAPEDVGRPARIPREPTSILKALAACVKEDPLAPNYRYHDDPFLIPLSNVKKRTYALSAEAGRRAAAWVRSEHENLFSTRVYDPPTKKTVPYHNADPPIPAYLPPIVWDSNAEATEADILKLVSLSRVEESISAYRSCKEPPSDGAKLALLQLLAYNNCSEPASDRWMEERWFRQAQQAQGANMANTWKVNSLAEELFQTFEGKSAEAYCTIILGMCKFHQPMRAYEMVQEARDRGHRLSTAVYNALLRESGFLKQGGEQRRALILQLLTEMNEQNLTPNIGTLNSALVGALGPGAYSNVVSPQDKMIASQILAEMERLGIVPSAGTWYLLLSIYCKERGPRSDILRPIVARLEQEDASGKPDSLAPARDLSDSFFFVTAMQVCNDHLQDAELARRVDALMRTGDRKRLVADGYKESVYHRHQMSLFARTLPLEEFLKVYDVLVPNRYIPEPSVMETILVSVGAGLTDFADRPAVDAARVDKFWEQIMAGALNRRQRIVELMMQICALAVKLEDSPDELARLSRVCDGIWETIEEQPTDRPANVNWTGDMLSHAILVYRECGDWAGARRAILRLKGAADAEPIRRGAVQVNGVPRDADPLVQSVKWSIERKDPSVAAALVLYLHENGYAEATDACRTALGLLMAPEDVKHFSGVAEAKLESLDGYLKDLLVVYRTVPEINADTSSTSSQSSSDDEDAPGKRGGE